MSRLRPLLLTALSLALAISVLHGAGGALDGPPAIAPDQWPGWVAHTDPVLVAFAVGRLAALAAAWYLLAVTALGVMVRLLQAGRATAVLDRLTVPPVRRLLATSLSLSLVAGTAAAVASPPGSRPAAAWAPAQVETTTPTMVGRPGTGDQPPPTVTMHRLPDQVAPPAANPPGTNSPGTNPPATDTPPTDLPAGVPPAPSAHQWTVEPGQCFWSIAEDVLRRQHGRTPSDREIVPYWRQLIAANRATLADPANPDLLFPGQVLTLVAPTAAPSPGLAATT